DPGVDPGKSLDRRRGAHLLALPRPPRGELDHPLGQAARADGDPPWQADQVHRREFRPRPFVAVVVERLEPGPGKLGIERLAGRVRARVALLEIDETDPERRHALRPDDPALIM